MPATTPQKPRTETDLNERGWKLVHHAYEFNYVQRIDVDLRTYTGPERGTIAGAVRRHPGGGWAAFGLTKRGQVRRRPLFQRFDTRVAAAHALVDLLPPATRRWQLMGRYAEDPVVVVEAASAEEAAELALARGLRVSRGYGPNGALIPIPA